MKPVLRDHCYETPPVWQTTHFWQGLHLIFQYNWTCHRRPPVLTDHIFVVNGVVFQDRFYCNVPYQTLHSDPCDLRPLRFKTSLYFKTIHQRHNSYIFYINMIRCVRNISFGAPCTTRMIAESVNNEGIICNLPGNYWKIKQMVTSAPGALMLCLTFCQMKPT